ncbi:hypothetical protein GCM10009730_58790 [Streptomyces albidochromogenes]|uniref:hypothetical protein n=1 Tax=Streptomyces albidochromogenes TaxID=329524 RepID=UPI00110F95CA|nr:hypothetical protein [Streptomyces albidochromogenes]
MADGIVGAIAGLFSSGRRREDELAQVDAEITAFGEMLAGHPFAPGRHQDDPGVLADYQRALDAYEQAKQNFVGDRNLRDAVDVLRALDEGRHALACVDAVVERRPRPQRRPLCFFDPRHGQSAEEVRWAPSEGAARVIAVCAADAVRLAEGMPPIENGLREQRPATQPASVPNVAGAAGAKRRTERLPTSAPPPHPFSLASPDPYETWPRRTSVRQRWESRGSTGAQLVRTDPRKPALLVVQLERATNSWVELTSPAGDNRRPRQILTHGSPLTRVIVPIESDGRDAIRLQMNTKGRWRIWLHPPEEIPLLEGELGSTGSYVLRHLGGQVPLRVTQHDGTAFSLHELRPNFRLGALLCQGNGSFTATAVAPRKAGLLYVQSRGAWSIAPPGGVHKAHTTP